MRISDWSSDVCSSDLFLGFSSGITTGVWMGRDDAHRVSGLQGGRAPARAFAQYMQVAVARRPVEQFDSELTLPEWQLEQDNEAYFGEPDNGMYVDENGMPLESEPGTETDMPAEPAAQTPETTTSPRLDRKSTRLNSSQ